MSKYKCAQFNLQINWNITGTLCSSYATVISSANLRGSKNMNNPIELSNNKVFAKNIHTNLINLLANEIDHSLWVSFVETAIKHLPQLDDKSGGRIPISIIENSFVGELGFTSWGEYLQTDTKKGGLGWTLTGWKRYKESYNLVCENSWLKELNLSVEQIRGLKKEYKKDWPIDANDHAIKRAEKSKSKEQAKVLAKEKAKEDKALLLEQIKQLSKFDEVKKDLADAKQKLVYQAKLYQQIGEQKQEIKSMNEVHEKEIKALNKELRILKKLSARHPIIKLLHWIKSLFGF
jgi:hypothetical protein